METLSRENQTTYQNKNIKEADDVETYRIPKVGVELLYGKTIVRAAVMAANGESPYDLAKDRYGDRIKSFDPPEELAENEDQQKAA